MTKTELIAALEPFDEDAVVVCMDDTGCWDNIEKVVKFGNGAIAIIFGGGSPFSDE